MALISVIICSHNPREAYLSRCLNGLRRQTLDTKSWELLLIDNASDQSLKLKGDISWHPNSRHVKESTLGLVWARYRGIQESVGEILIFVDDDNVLDPEYLFKAAQLGRNWPMLGTWGAGIISPEFEAEPATHLKDFLYSLALREVSTPRWTNVLPCADATPWGAGLCVRRNVAEAYRRLGQELETPNHGANRGDALKWGRHRALLCCGQTGIWSGDFSRTESTPLNPQRKNIRNPIWLESVRVLRFQTCYLITNGSVLVQDLLSH